MNHDQLRKYRFEWNKARKVLRQTMSPKDADAERHALHVKALGNDKSSTLLNNKEFDAILKEFRAISRASDFKGQQKLADMGAARKRWTIRHLLTALELNEEAAETLLTRRQRGGVLVTASESAIVTFETIGEDDLERVMIDLKKKCRKRWPRKGDLLTEIRLMGMARDLDAQAINTAMGVPPGFGCEDLNYEQLLQGLSTLRTKFAEVAELADAPDTGAATAGGDHPEEAEQMQVQILPSAPDLDGDPDWTV